MVERSAVTRWLAAAALGATAFATTAQAQTKPAGYPTKAIRIVVGIAAGGGLDLASRIGAQKMNERWNEPVIVDNRPGGGSLVATDIVARAPADGYTLLGASDSIMLLGLMKRTAYEVRDAFVPVVALASQPYMLAVTPSLPVESVKELIAYGKAKPGALTYGSQGLGSTGHIAMERFRLATGIEMVHVPYKSAPIALVDIAGGQIQLMFASTVSTGPYLRGGKLKALAVTSLRRNSAYPNIPTVSESGVAGFEAGNRYSFYAPKGTPGPIVQAIASVVSKGMNAPEIAKSLAADGSEVAPPTPPAEFKARFDKQYADLEKLIRTSNIKLN